MKRLILELTTKSLGTIKFEGTDENLLRDEVRQYIDLHKDAYAFGGIGDHERTIQVLVSEEVPEMREIQSALVAPEVRDPVTNEVITEAVYEDQEVITQEYAPAVYRDEVIPAEYTIEITDVTAETEANAEMAYILAALAEEDYKVTKFREQQELGIDTDMTVAEYTLLLAQRQAKRTRYREIETLLGLR